MILLWSFLVAVDATSYALHLAPGLPSTAMILVWWWCSATKGVKPAAALAIGGTKTRSVGIIPSIEYGSFDEPDLVLVLGCVFFVSWTWWLIDGCRRWPHHFYFRIHFTLGILDGLALDLGLELGVEKE